MSVRRRKLPSGAVRFEVRYTDGTGRRRSRSFDTRADARRYDTTVTRQKQIGVDLAVEEARRLTTVQDLVDVWVDVHAPALTDRAADTYAIQIDKRIVPYLGHRRACDLTAHDVNLWIALMRDDGDGPATINKACTVLQRLLTIGKSMGVVTANVVADADRPSQRPERQPVLIDVQSVELMRYFMLGHGWIQDVVLLELLAYAGLRPESEALTVRWDDFAGGELMVRAGRKRGAQDRRVRLLDPLAELLERERHLATGDLIVPAPRGRAWTETQWDNWRARRFRPAAAFARLPSDVRPRDLRGSFESLLIHEGRSIVDVSTQLGHAPETALRHYLQTPPGPRVEAVSAVLSARSQAPFLALGDAYSTHDPNEEEQNPDAQNL